MGDGDFGPQMSADDGTRELEYGPPCWTVSPNLFGRLEYIYVHTEACNTDMRTHHACARVRQRKREKPLD